MSAGRFAAAEPLVWRAERFFDLAREGKKTIPAMAGLRGAAVFLVFLTHYASLTLPWLQPHGLTYAVSQSLAAVGHSGVDLFFVLSGYLIYGTLLRSRQSIATFFKRRVRRIYPAFGCVLAFYLVLSILLPQEHKLPPNPADWPLYVLENALLLPGIFNIRPIIIVAWSLSYEAFFYVLAPILVIGLGLKNRTRSGRIAVLLLLTAGGFFINWWLMTGRMRLMMFAAGMLLFEVVDARPSVGKKPWGLVAALTALTVLMASASLDLSALWRCVLLFACFGLLCLDALHWRTATARVLSWAPLRWLGNMSYSYYLLHGLTLKASMTALHSIWPTVAMGDLLFWLLLPLFWVATLGPTTLLFGLVEKKYSFAAPSAPRIAVDQLQNVSGVVASGSL
jgi:peptidoglycan/LPS O-acetylase OafA/YrhL